MHDEAHVRLVEAHSEGDGRANDAHAAAEEARVHAVALLEAHACGGEGREGRRESGAAGVSSAALAVAPTLALALSRSLASAARRDAPAG